MNQFFQQSVVNAISKGDVHELEKALVGNADINRTLLPQQKLFPIPSISKRSNCPSIYGPTMLIYAVLCERPEIVKYILSKNPDLSIKVNGYNALHYAALTNDCSCLKILITCQYYQDYIYEPISDNNFPDSKTNALHIAVSNKNIISAALLLDDLPLTIKYYIPDNPVDAPKRKIEKNKENSSNSDIESNSNESDDDDCDNDDDDSSGLFEEIRGGIDVNSVTSSGSSPLHIATYLRDYNICRLLLCYSADLSLEDSRGRTPIDLAKSFNSKKYNDILELFDNPPNESPSSILKQIAPHLALNSSQEEPILDIGPDANKKEEEEEEETENDEKEFRKNKKRKKNKTNQLLTILLHKVEQLNYRIQNVERQVELTVKDGRSTSIPKNILVENIVDTKMCENCQAGDTQKCSICHHIFCSKCMKNVRIHKCIV